jgi:hypothetical protein
MPMLKTGLAGRRYGKDKYADTDTIPPGRREMSRDYIPSQINAFPPFAVNYHQVAQAHGATLGLSSSQLSNLLAVINAANTEIEEAVQAKKAYEGALQARDEALETAKNLIRELSRGIQARPQVSDQLKQQLGLTVRDHEPTPVVPSQPLNLVADSLPSGTNKLRWKRNGNPSGVTFVVETRKHISEPWTMIGATQKAKFAHMDQMVGGLRYYRVVAMSAHTRSEPSNIVVVYANNVVEVLQIAA